MFRPQLAIVSCNTIDYTGAYVTDMEQAEIKWQMMKNARESILLVDHTKFHSEYSDYIHLADLSSWSTIITDARPKNAFLLKMKQLGVKVIYPGFK
ncbi:DeoR family transcriptional regulator [Lactiplantibacillus plantarum]|nr:DeoR family transcriptional regulator [Lactiplantibacillus plantarum]